MVRRLYDAFARRDIDAALELCDPAAELWPTATARLASVEGPYRGHEGLRRYFDDIERLWGELLVFPNEFRAMGDCVVVTGRVSGRRAISVYAETGWVWRVRKGKVVYCRVYTDPEEALAAAELTA